jgi:hypothetical protein
MRVSRFFRGFIRKAWDKAKSLAPGKMSRAAFPDGERSTGAGAWDAMRSRCADSIPNLARPDEVVVSRPC